MLLSIFRKNFLEAFSRIDMIFLSYDFRRLAQFVFSLVAAMSVMMYFIFHAIKGDRGILAWSKLESELSIKEDELKKVEANFQAFDRKVKNFGNNICLDLLEEQSIRVLGFSDPGNIVLIDKD